MHNTFTYILLTVLSASFAQAQGTAKVEQSSPAVQSGAWAEQLQPSAIRTKAQYGLAFNGEKSETFMVQKSRASRVAQVSPSNTNKQYTALNAQLSAKAF